MTENLNEKTSVDERSIPKVGTNSVSAELTDEQMRELYDRNFPEFIENSLIKGTVVAITDKEVMIDIGYKSEGVIPINEFRSITDLKVGQSIDVYLETLEDSDGAIVISKLLADKMLNWERTVEAYHKGEIIEGTVYKKIKGGLMVDIGMDAFLPGSQISLKPMRNFDDNIGQKLFFKIIKVDEVRKNVVLSHRVILEEAKRKERERLLSEIQVDQIRKGVVKNITDFGAFIDLNGIDGLLHITDMTWGRINHPSEMLSVGEEIDVMILDFDIEKERVSLGLKQRFPNPWEGVEAKYPVGTKVKGSVVNIVAYGAFIELEEGVEGLIHISELSWTKRVNHPSEMLSVGDVVEAVILNLDKDQQRISLGLKQMEANPWQDIDERYQVDTIVEGVVRNLTNYGAFVELEEGIDGLVHITDLSWSKKIKHPGEILQKGQEVTVKVLGVDKDNHKISLGIKQLESSPWEKALEQYQVGDCVEGVVRNITSFGAFVELDEGVEALLHISEISDRAFNKITEVLSEGDTVKAKIIKIDIDEKRIGISKKEFDLEAAVSGEPEVVTSLKSDVPEEETVSADMVEEDAKAIVESVKEAQPEEDETVERADEAGVEEVEPAEIEESIDTEKVIKEEKKKPKAKEVKDSSEAEDNESFEA